MSNKPWDPLSPEFREQMERISRQVAEFVRQSMPAIDALTRQQERMRRQIQRIIQDAPAIQALVDQQRQIEQFVRQIQVIDPAVLKRFQKLLEAAEPPNWPEGRDRDVIELIERTHWPLVWVPNKNVVADMLDCADDAALDQLMIDRAEEILASTSARLDEIPVSFSPMSVKAAREAIAAFPAAPMATQSLAATIFESILRQSLGYPSLRAATTDLESATDWKEESFRLLRWALIRSCIPNVLTEFWPGKGDPIPTQFNRHASVHALSQDQYTLANALVGVMLIVTMLRELYQLEADGFI